jgi:hypothetical protein
LAENRSKGKCTRVKKGRKLEPNNLKGTKLGSPSWENGLESGSHGELREESSRYSGLLRAASSSLSLQSRVLRSRSGNGIYRGQDSGVSLLVLKEDPRGATV